MRCPKYLPLVGVGLAALFTLGCGGSLSLSQRLVGEWVGRPETRVDRTVREWPSRAGGKKVLTDNPEVAEAIAKAPVSDLEAVVPEVLVRIEIGELGEATLSLAGEEPLTGKWVLTPLDGRKAQLEIEVQPPSEEEKSVRRRFDLEFFKDGDAFTLREQSADRRFGRLVFRRPSGDEKPTQTEPVVAEGSPSEPVAGNSSN